MLCFCRNSPLFRATTLCTCPEVGGRSGFLMHSALISVCMSTLTVENVWLNSTWLLDVNWTCWKKAGKIDLEIQSKPPGRSTQGTSLRCLFGGRISETMSDHPVLQSPSHLAPNPGLNYHAGQGSRFPSHTHILWFGILPTASVLSFNSEKAFQRGHRGHGDDLKLWGRRSFPFPDLTSATQFEVPFLPLSFKEEKLLNSPGLRIVKNLITSSLYLLSECISQSIFLQQIIFNLKVTLHHKMYNKYSEARQGIAMLSIL